MVPWQFTWYCVCPMFKGSVLARAAPVCFPTWCPSLHIIPPLSPHLKLLQQKNNKTLFKKALNQKVALCVFLLLLLKGMENLQLFRQKKQKNKSFRFLQCIPIPGRGFRLGQYCCRCKEGYYNPEIAPQDLGKSIINHDHCTVAYLTVQPGCQSYLA